MVVDSFLGKGKYHLEVAESETAIVNGIYIETDGSKAIKVEKIAQVVTIN
jgi:hypothetical protein